jgi:hypothetical protein
MMITMGKITRPDNEYYQKGCAFCTIPQVRHVNYLLSSLRVRRFLKKFITKKFSGRIILRYLRGQV